MGAVPPILYAVAFFDLFAASMLVPALPQFLLSLNATPQSIGGIKSLYSMLQLLSAPFAGSLSDHVGRRRVLFASVIGPALGYLGLSLATTLPQVVLSRIPPGVCKHTQDVIKLAVTDKCTPAERTPALGKLQACSSLGFILGPALGGYLSKFPHGFQTTARVVTLVFCLNFVLIYVYCPEHAQDKNRGLVHHQVASERSSWHQVLQHHIFEFQSTFRREGLAKSMLLLRLIVVLGVLIFRNHWMLVLEQKFGADAQGRGTLLSFMGACSAFGSANVGHVVLAGAERRWIVLMSLSLAIATVFIARATSLSMIYFIIIPYTWSLAVLRPTTVSMQLKYVDRDHIGTFMGVSSSMTSLARVVAPLVSGMLLDVSLDAPAYVASLVSLLSGFLYWRMIERVYEPVSYRTQGSLDPSMKQA